MLRFTSYLDNIQTSRDKPRYAPCCDERWSTSLASRMAHVASYVFAAAYQYQRFVNKVKDVPSAKVDKISGASGSPSELSMNALNSLWNGSSW